MAAFSGWMHNIALNPFSDRQMRHAVATQKLAAALAAASMMVAGAEVLAAPLKIDPAKSSVSATFRQMGVAVDTSFRKFNAQVDYDAAKPEKSKATVEIEIPSFDLGDADYNKEVLKKEWFNAAQFPKASFVSSSIRSSGPGKLDVSGKLTIKGKTADVSFPLTVKKEGGATLLEGSLPIKRLAFNVGDGEWKDTSIVADEVTIRFRVVGQ
jgi:polyisoprenoid-binding protein YceI